MWSQRKRIISNFLLTKKNKMCYQKIKKNKKCVEKSNGSPTSKSLLKKCVERRKVLKNILKEEMF